MITLAQVKDLSHVGREWCKSSIINLVYIVGEHKVPYVKNLGRNCCMST
jgi:hypothetical protein